MSSDKMMNFIKEIATMEIDYYGTSTLYIGILEDLIDRAKELTRDNFNK